MSLVLTFIGMESYCVFPFVSGISLNIKLWNSFVLSYAVAVSSVSLLYSNQFEEYMPRFLYPFYCLPAFVYFAVFAHFKLCCYDMIWTFLYLSFGDCIYRYLLGVMVPGDRVLTGLEAVSTSGFPMWFYPFISHQRRMRILIVPYSCQRLVLFSFLTVAIIMVRFWDAIVVRWLTLMTSEADRRYIPCGEVPLFIFLFFRFIEV